MLRSKVGKNGWQVATNRLEDHVFEWSLGQGGCILEALIDVLRQSNVDNLSGHWWILL
jgi:hypothetical protein